MVAGQVSMCAKLSFSFCQNVDSGIPIPASNVVLQGFEIKGLIRLHRARGKACKSLILTVFRVSRKRNPQSFPQLGG
jgi:hypothetical protein